MIQEVLIMPLYKYVHDDGFGSGCTQEFEALQDLSEPEYTLCPDCSQPVHRIMGNFAPVKSERGMLSNKNLSEKGFTKYVKAGDGYYEKTAGEGPQVISGK